MEYYFAVNLRPLEKNKSLDELVHEVELAAYLATARSINDFNKKIKGILRPFGIDRFCHTDLSRDNGTGALGLLDPVGNFDPKVTDRYAKEGFNGDDMMRWHLEKKRTSMFRTTLVNYMEKSPFDHDLFKRNREINKFLVDVGMQDVLNIPILAGETYGVFSISIHHGESRTLKETVAKNRKTIFELADSVDRVGRNKFSQFHSPRISRLPITAQTIDILEMMAKKDLSGPEVAELLGIHEQTVQKHIAAAKKALGVRTLPGLTMAAIKAGLISVYSD